MNVLPSMEIVDLGLYFDSALVIADVHIGYEEALNKQGVLVPRLQFEEIVKRMESILNKLKGREIHRIIVNGDLKHEFGTISEQEWRNTLKFLDLLARHCEEIVLVKGNHDTILGPIAKKRNVKVVDCYLIDYNKNEYNNGRPLTKKNKPGKALIIHGDRIPEKKFLQQAGTVIIGHEHPAISIKEGPRVETYKCFLKGRYKGRNLIVQPSFNTIIEGTNILRDKVLSPFLKQKLANFEVYAVEDKVYDFGKLKDLR